jgi:hypothetical protein
MQRHPEVAGRILAEPGEVFAIVNEIVDAGVRANEVARDKAPRVVAFTIASLMGMSAYANSLGRPYLELAAKGFLDLLDGQLFKSGKAG